MPTQFHLTIRETDGTLRNERVQAGSYSLGRDRASDLVFSSQDVSRHHARVTFEARGFTIEDLDSSFGTTVNGAPLIAAKHFPYPQTFCLGGVSIYVKVEEVPEPAAPHPPARPAPTPLLAGTAMPTAPVKAKEENDVTITVSLDATERTSIPLVGVAAQMASRLQMLYELPLQFASEPDVKKLYQLILDRIIDLIPGAKRGAVLIYEAHTGQLAVQASVPDDNPPISRTLIRRAAEEQRAFIWSDEQSFDDLSLSIVKMQIRTGMYVPLLWKGQTLGVICTDNPKHRSVFRPEDLQFMVSVAHYAASAVANQLLQNDIETNNRTLQHLLGNFSPKLRTKLLQKAKDGQLQPGGEKSNVSILMSDLRGFTRTSATHDSETVVAMLNDYFSVLGDIIFRHDGTIDKFIGDAILAIFGSPERDDQHAIKAVLCAREMQRAMREINQRRSEKNLPCCELGVGIHTGEVLHGFIGARERMEFTVIGDTVNKADRYCDGAAPGEIVMGPETHEAVKTRIRALPKTITTKHEGEWEAWSLEHHPLV